MRYLIPVLAVALTGCATTEYESYAKAQADVAKSRADADTARYNALSKIAETGTDSSKIAAVMALALGGNQTQATGNSISAPQPNAALQWASILVPSLTNVAGMVINGRVAMANADNNARIAESTNSAFLGIAGKIQAPVVAAPVMPQANVSTVTTTTTDNHASTTNTSTSNATTSTSSVANPTTTTTSTSLGGSGVLGSGTYNASPTTTNTNTSTSTGTVPVVTTTPATTAKVCPVGTIVSAGPGC